METVLSIAGGIFLGLVGVIGLIVLLLWGFVQSRKAALNLLRFQKELILCVIDWVLSKIFPIKKR